MTLWLWEELLVWVLELRLELSVGNVEGELSKEEA